MSEAVWYQQDGMMATGDLRKNTFYILVFSVVFKRYRVSFCFEREICWLLEWYD